MSGPATWLRDPALIPVWSAARARLERNGVQPQGMVDVAGLDRASRHAVSGLLGRPVVRDRVRVDLGVLDSVLRERSGAGGLVAVLEGLGPPLRNRVAERSAKAAAREAPYVAVRALLAQDPAIAAVPWLDEWLAGVRRSGVLARVADETEAADRLVRAVGLAAERTTAVEPVAVARTELAAGVTGDAHALDEGSLLGHLVLRALAAAAQEPVPLTVSGRRALWERYAVSADAVSSTALVLGLRPNGDGSLARRLALATEAGAPVHVTGWDLGRDAMSVAAGTWVLVCENPRVLEAVAQAHAGRVAAVCTSGMPGLVTLDLLRRLASSGAALAYHGDFDWPGIAIANRLVAEVGAQPWRLSAADYLAGARADGPLLAGPPVEAVWDRALCEAMRDRGVAVHEEAILPDLVAALL